MTFSSLGRKSREFGRFWFFSAACGGNRVPPDHNLGLASQAFTFRASGTNRLNSKLKH